MLANSRADQASRATVDETVRSRLERAYWTVAFSAFLVGAVIRIGLVSSASFPLNDGGLFYTMAEDLERQLFRLPAYTSYNGGEIPFAYPPLGLYLAAALNALTGWRLLDLFRWLPLAANLATMGAFFVLVRTLLAARVAQLAALFAFVLAPHGFQWLIMGGGVTRSFGALFAVLAFQQTYQLYRTGRRRHLALASLLAGLTVLSHLEWAWCLGYSIVLAFFCFSRAWRGLIDSLLLATGATVLSAPWWLAVVGRFGLSPFLAATHDGWSALDGAAALLTLRLTDEPWFPVLGGLTVLGIAVCVRQRDLFLPCWLVAMFLLDPRSALTTAVLPEAALGGLALQRVVLPLLGVTGPAAGTGPLPRGRQASLPLGASLALGLLVLYASFAALFDRPDLMTALSPDTRAAMVWARQHTPPTASFVVATTRGWPVDTINEWFPALSHRVSVSTVQGSEWLPDDAFDRKIKASESLEECAAEGASCLARWGTAPGCRFAYVFVPTTEPADPHAPGHPLGGDPLAPLRHSLDRDPRFQLIYRGSGAVIYRYRNSVP